MKITMRTIDVAGSRAAFASAAIKRSSRNSRARIRKDWAKGVPYFSV